MTNFLGWLISGLLFLIVIFINRLPYMLENRILQDQKTRDSHEIQIESYFKELGGKEQKEVLEEWSKILIYMEPVSDVNKLNKLIHKTVIYGSVKTINILSLMTQYTYTDMKTDLERESKSNSKFMIYVAFLCCSLKQDFSGQQIDPLTLLKVKISDIKESENEYMILIGEIEEEIDNV
ncbi:hypothetical protein ACXDFG_04260 [Pediococcus pentosaceus]|jgi:hypothetical protein